MQLIKDFSELQRFVSFLNYDYQQKLLADINSLVAKYMEEQARSTSPVQPSLQQANASTITPPPPPSLSSFAPKTFTPPAPPPTLSKPPTSLPSSLPSSLPINLGANSLNKGGFTLQPNKLNKKTPLSFYDALGYLVPYLTDMGTDQLKNPSLPMDVFKLYKQLDGTSSLKEIYLAEYQNIKLGTFLEKIQSNFKERNVNIKKKQSLPTDFELQMKLGDVLIALGFITDSDLQRALQAQKNPETQNASNQAPAWLAKTMASVDNNDNKMPIRKKLLGDTLVELNIINQDQLNFSLAIQRLFRNIIESR
ncbi:MAG: hypothetical protein U0457_11365 [Candidatus Sericytochromatia bacterium]